MSKNQSETEKTPKENDSALSGPTHGEEDDLDEKSDNVKPKSFCGCFKKKKKEELLPDGESDDQKDSGSDPSIKKSATAAEPVLSEGSQNPWDNAPNSQCYCMTDETRKLKPQ